tara:strand:+ start:223 stop:1137 length:915 start_codon:yes stop_codon:yes gene_type:complete
LKNNINWEKIGLIIKPEKNLPWTQSHCMVPTPYHMKEGLYKVYFSGRDANNVSHISYAVVDLNLNGKVISYSKKPVLSPGKLGCFDDNGVTPSCIFNIEKNKLALYYIGWNPGSTVRMHLFGGLAISNDDGETFTRWSEAPILERNKTDPYLNTAPWVVKVKNGFRIYYVSGDIWINKDLPRYNIKTGFSKDGKNWERSGEVCIDFKDEAENALARPYVIFENNIWKMWFSYKGNNYRIGYAESNDGIKWDRNDEGSGIDVSHSGFDSEMIEYAAIVKHNEKYFMFYNGNNYGSEGIGLAVEKI